MTGSPGQPWKLRGPDWPCRLSLVSIYKMQKKPSSISQTEEAVEWEQVWCKEQVLPTPESKDYFRKLPWINFSSLRQVKFWNDTKLKLRTQSYSRIFFSYADPSEKFHFSNRYNFCSDELFRLKSKKISILSGILLLLAHKYSLRCLVSILDLKIFHLGRHRKKIRLYIHILQPYKKHNCTIK